MAKMVERDSPDREVSNDELIENCLILVQQIFAENLISDEERDHLKGKYRLGSPTKLPPAIDIHSE